MIPLIIAAYLNPVAVLMAACIVLTAEALRLAIGRRFARRA